MSGNHVVDPSGRATLTARADGLAKKVFDQFDIGFECEKSCGEPALLISAVLMLRQEPVGRGLECCTYVEMILDPKAIQESILDPSTRFLDL